MSATIEGLLDAKGMRFALLVARTNELVSHRLLAGAEDGLARLGASPESITVVRAPGAWELPLVAQKLATSGAYDAVIALGALIRGETPHFDVLAAEVAKGLAAAAMDTGVPVVFGVLTTDSLDQALERAGGKAGNKGWDATIAAVEMVSLIRRLG